MPLSCFCDFEPEAGDWYWVHPEEYSTLQTTRRKRCQSCNNLIDIGLIVAQFPRMKIPYTDIELSIYGEDGEIPLAPFYFCEICADLYFSLFELGFECLGPGEDMREMVKEYAVVYGPRNQMEDC